MSSRSTEGQIEDAVVATAEVLTAPPGVYNVIDDDPSPVAVWLPAFARFVGAPPPPRITEEQARASAGEASITARSSAAPRTRMRRRRSASSPSSGMGGPVMLDSLGYAGTAVMIAAYAPQIWHLYRERCSAGISVRAYALWIGGSLLFLGHATID